VTLLGLELGDGQTSGHEQQDSSEAFKRECVELGQLSAASRLRLDAKGPEAYREAHLTYRGPKSRKPYFERKWLSLRLSAIKRGMLVDGSVTPQFLAQTTGWLCPVTLQMFSRDDRSPDNPSVDRLSNEFTYVAGNICVLSRRANRAKGERSFEEVLRLAQTKQPSDGLSPQEWSRLASLMYGVWARQKRHDPYLIPLAALPAPHIFITVSQLAQSLLTHYYSAPERHDEGTALFLRVTRAAGCGEQRFSSVREQLTAALSEAEYAGDAWLHSAVFDAFSTWYDACRLLLVPLMERLADARAAQYVDPVATLEWPKPLRHNR
jgi:hypothetical protein